MNSNTAFLFIRLLLIPCILISSCNNGKKEPAAAPKDTLIVPVKRTEKADQKERPPIINMVDTVAPKRIIIFAKDSARTYERIGLKLGKIYGGKLAETIKKNNLTMTGAPLAWYKTTKAPFFFEAGLQVNKRPAKLTGAVQVRELPAGNVVVAHFYGPYNLMPQGYEAIREWIKVNKKISAGAPFEIYITDPVGKDGKPLDPYKVQTDIVFPVK
jgi:effector-binding domain-containing protein